jgi:MipA family protein
MKLHALAAAVLFSSAAAAGALEPAGTPLPLWEVGVFGGTASTPAYPGSDDRSARTLILPFLIYRGEVLRSDQAGIGARLLHTDLVEFDVGFALSLPARSDDVAARRGMPDLGSLIEFGPRLKVNLAKPGPGSRVRLEAPLRAVIEVKSGLRRQGLAFEPKLVYEIDDWLGAWNLDLSLGIAFGNASLNNYFYQVQPQFATGERPAHQAKSGLMLARAGASAWRKLGPDLRVFGFVRYDNYAQAANRASPLFRQNTGASAGIGLAWTLRRSQTVARE